MTKKSFSSDELLDAALKAYRQKGWVAQSKFSVTEETFVGSLSRRPEAIAKNDGMEHLIFVPGTVTEGTFKFLKQVLFEMWRAKDPSHVVVVCSEKVSQAHEQQIKALGVGIVVVRVGADPLALVTPRLCCFEEPDYERIPPRLRTSVKKAIGKIVEGDVTVGVLDLSQILEKEFKRRLPAFKHKPLGVLIKEARKAKIISDLQASACTRVNDPRIKRAHPGSHAVRRRIVQEAQHIVDDCLAILFAIA